MNDFFLYFDSNFTEIVPRSPIGKKAALVQVTTWINTEPVHWRIYAALGGDELNIGHYDSSIQLG